MKYERLLLSYIPANNRTDSTTLVINATSRHFENIGGSDEV